MTAVSPGDFLVADIYADAEVLAGSDEGYAPAGNGTTVYSRENPLSDIEHDMERLMRDRA